MSMNGSDSAAGAPKAKNDYSVQDEIELTLRTLFQPTDVFEIRALISPYKTVVGYFQYEKIDTVFGLMNKAVVGASGVYVVLNEIDPALLARAPNRFQTCMGKESLATSDRDVRRRRWLPLDFDPIRVAGISSSDAEKAAAKQRAIDCGSYLKNRGWPAPIFADSGNGYHLLFPIDLEVDRSANPTNEPGKVLVERVLKSLSLLFSDGAVKLDTSLFNASRIIKLYGTIARKGADIPERPHRRSHLIEIPDYLREASATDR
jgi:hypothetical protein